ncbi:MAG TPA: hypothetical protein VFS08_19570 [Gemmatimonadaceae bacterium]|nr:hypothetical protein [Gemmatimonadaceae bacterium]
MPFAPLALARHPAALLPALLLAVLLGAACSSSRSGERPTPGDRSVITRAQLQAHQFASVYDAVLTLHSNWLRPRGTDSFTNPTQVLVYVDGSRLGGVETLRTLPVGSVNYIQHIDGLTASARWGLDHGQGVIYVSTTPPLPPRDSVPVDTLTDTTAHTLRAHVRTERAEGVRRN